MLARTVSMLRGVPAPPVIDSFTPDAAVGETVVILGKHFAHVLSVAFTGAVASVYTVNSPTQITVTVPAGAVTGLISVTTPKGTATSVTQFVVDPHVYWSQNFDGAVVPALPAGYGSENGTVVTSTDVAFSGTQSLKMTANGAFVRFFHPTITDTSQCCTRMEAKFWPRDANPSDACYAGLSMRCVTGVPTESGATYYPGYQITFGFDQGYCDLRYIDASHNPVNITPQFQRNGMFATRTWYRSILEVEDAADGWYVSVRAFVQRMSDGAWLQPDGTWQLSDAPVALFSAQHQIGYISAWANGGIGMVTCYIQSDKAIYVDDVKFSDVAARGPTIPNQPRAMSGGVEYIGAITTDSAGLSGHETNKLNDGNPLHYYKSSARWNGWAMMDLTSANRICGFLWSPGQNNDSNGEPDERYMAGAVFEGANATAGPWAVLATWGTDGYPEPNVLNVVALSGPSVAYKYVRIRSPLGPLNVSVFRVMAELGIFVPWRPMPAAMAPAAGRFAAGRTVTIADMSGNGGLFYYTVDGTDPAVIASVPQGTTMLYTAPFALASASPAETTVKAIKYDPSNDATNKSSQIVAGKYVVPGVIVPDTLATAYGTSNNWPQNWYDDRGVLLNSNGGHITYDSAQTGRYYWVGQTRNGFGLGVTYLGVFHTPFWLYSSADLLNWTVERQILFHIPTTIQGNFGPLTVGGRPVFFQNPNPTTPNRQYLLYFQVRAGTDSDVPSHVAVLAAPTMNGPYTFLNAFVPTGFVKDSWTVFLDPATSKVWVVCIDRAWVLDPATDYSTETGETQLINGEEGGSTKEAPIVFVANGNYFLICGFQTPFGGSSQNGQFFWVGSTFADLATVSNRGHPWKPQNPVAGQEGLVAYNVQFGSVFKVHGVSGPGLVALTDLQDAGEVPVNMYHARSALYPINNAAFLAADNLSISVHTSSWDPAAVWP